MSEGARNTRQFRGAWSGGGGTGGIGSASYRDGDGGIGSPRYSGAVCTAASVSRRLRAVAERVLWRELCISRAPRMVASLTAAAGAGAGAGAAPPPPGRIGGGWPALAKLLSFCCGAAGKAVPVPVPGHLTRVSRFSKTSGRSFLSRRCRSDLLYVSDLCEHAVPGADDEPGAYRGCSGGSCGRGRGLPAGLPGGARPERALPLLRRARLNMVAANLVPRGASRRMGSDEGRLEYYVCVSGHVHGNCWLAHLTSSDGEHDESDQASGGSSGEDGDVAQ
ncbi:hypothetical protein ZWY2020_019799 [Hordeum vulgare]|nr:hypothetical protein ZWY2020_019799 [Hordeum vulgare]